jgi:hypothetical protein
MSSIALQSIPPCVEACNLTAQPFFASFYNSPALFLTAFFVLSCNSVSCLFPAIVPTSPTLQCKQGLRRPVEPYTDITRQALQHKFWVLGGATVPSEMSPCPCTHHSTCNTRIQFLFIRNGQARSKECHCITSTVSAPGYVLSEHDSDCSLPCHHCA